MPTRQPDGVHHGTKNRLWKSYLSHRWMIRLQSWRAHWHGVLFIVYLLLHCCLNKTHRTRQTIVLHPEENQKNNCRHIFLTCQLPKQTLERSPNYQTHGWQSINDLYQTLTENDRNRRVWLLYFSFDLKFVCTLTPAIGINNRFIMLMRGYEAKLNGTFRQWEHRQLLRTCTGLVNVLISWARELKISVPQSDIECIYPC